MYKGSTNSRNHHFYQNALRLTKVHFATFYQSALRQELREDVTSSRVDSSERGVINN